MKNYSSDLFSSWKIKNEEIENKSSALNMKKEDEIKEIDENFNSNFSLDDTEIINNDSIDQIDYSKSSLKIENISKINQERLTLFHGRNEENERFYLIFDSKMILLLKEHPNEFGIGLFEWKRLLKQLKKVVISKKVKNEIILDFGDFQQQLILNDIQKFFKFIQAL